MKRVKEFMNKNVICLSPDDTVFEAAKLFSELDIAGAPVVDNDKVVGVISLSDIIKFIDIRVGNLPKIELPGLSWVLLAFFKMQKLHMDLGKELEKVTKSKVKEVMTKDVIAVSPSSTLIEVAELMDKHDINRLPVVYKGKLVGIVARADLIKALVD